MRTINRKIHKNITSIRKRMKIGHKEEEGGGGGEGEGEGGGGREREII